jgi:hypothetical protein
VQILLATLSEMQDDPTKLKIQLIVAIFMGNGFKGSQTEGERIAAEILRTVEDVDAGVVNTVFQNPT